MDIRSRKVEQALKSTTLSFLLFLIWGTLTANKARALLDHYDLRELVFVIYNATIAILFLVRSRPSEVSMNPWHWAVALITSFAGLFFTRDLETVPPFRSAASEGVMFAGLLIGFSAALALGRSYDFLPALRGVQTQWLYKLVRHPMYLSSIIIRLGYLIAQLSSYNVGVFVVMVLLYQRRAAYEEQVMCKDARYRTYLTRVRYRFIPLVY